MISERQIKTQKAISNYTVGNHALVRIQQNNRFDILQVILSRRFDSGIECIIAFE